MKRKEMGQREQRQQQGAKQAAGSKADWGSGCRDMELAEKCWRYVDVERYLGRGRKNNIRKQSRKGERMD